LLRTEKIEENLGTYNLEFGELQAGLYLLKVISENGNIGLRKIIKL